MEASDTPAAPNEPQPLPTNPDPAPPEQPGDVGEALQQMRQSIEDLKARVPDPTPEQADPGTEGLADQLLSEYEDEYEQSAPQPEQPAQPEAEQLTEDEIVARYIREEATAVAQQQVQEAFQAQTVQQRHAQIAALPDRYPRMKEPEVVAQVAARLRGLAAEVGDSVWNSPAAVESAYQAYEAALRQSSEGSPEGESHAATLETGGGPAVPEPELTPEEKAYAKVFEQVEGSDPLTR